jgi:hypothetical protein
MEVPESKMEYYLKTVTITAVHLARYLGLDKMYISAKFTAQCLILADIRKYCIEPNKPF